MKNVIQKFLDTELSISTHGASVEDLFEFQDIVGLTWSNNYHSLGYSSWLIKENNYLYAIGKSIRYGTRPNNNNVKETMTVAEFLELCCKSSAKIEEHDIMELFS